MSNKIKYGLKNVHYAVATIASDNTATYGTVKPLPGAVSMSLDQQGEVTPFYADNVTYYTTVANNGYQGDLELALVPDSFKKDVLGYIEDSQGVLVENADAPTVYFALIFQFEGDANARRHVLYNCTANRPSVSGQTKEDNITPQTETMQITAKSIYNNVLAKNVVKASADESNVNYAGWFSSVYQSTSGGGVTT
jgi:phi13 family phage major tail protein